MKHLQKYEGFMDFFNKKEPYSTCSWTDYEKEEIGKLNFDYVSVKGNKGYFEKDGVFIVKKFFSHGKGIDDNYYGLIYNKKIRKLNTISDIKDLLEIYNRKKLVNL